MHDSDATQAPNLIDLAALIDGASELESLNVRFRLNEISKEADKLQNGVLLAAIRIERAIFTTFENRRAFDNWSAALCTMLTPDDLDYVKGRAATTTNPRAKTRYLHAIAAITLRHDDGQIAAQSYIDAIEHYHDAFQASAAESFHALLDIIPLGYVVARRYKRADALKSVVIEFLLDDLEMASHVKAKIFITAINESWFTAEEAAKLKEFSLVLPGAVRGGDDGEITAAAAAGMRLAERLGEPRRLWQAAEARALEARLDYKSHPMLVEVIGTKLFRLYQLLGEEENRQNLIAQMREARAQIDYQTISFKPEGLDTAIKDFEEKARAMVAEHGPRWTLLWLSANKELLPSVARLEEQMDEMAAEGIGSFRQFATMIVSGDERLLARDDAGDGTSDHQFNEQYGIFWQFSSVLPFLVFMTQLIRGGELRPEHFEQQLAQSWMGRQESIAYGGGEMMPNDLVALLMISMRAYCMLLTEEVPSEFLVPTLDSVVLKFEAILRKLARLLGITHLKATTGQGRPLMEVAGLELLENERVIEVCGDDLIAYATYTLERKPEGLRDRIGHAILHLDQYNPTDLHAVVQLVLRFASVEVPDSATQEGAQAASATADGDNTG
jgi:hypothetical protein